MLRPPGARSLSGMARTGSTIGTVVRWDAERRGAIIEAPELPGGCWADASVVEHSTGGPGELRAGQVVSVEWTDDGAEELPFRALRVVPREDLQATLGG